MRIREELFRHALNSGNVNILQHCTVLEIADQGTFSQVYKVRKQGGELRFIHLRSLPEQLVSVHCLFDMLFCCCCCIFC